MVYMSKWRYEISSGATEGQVDINCMSIESWLDCGFIFLNQKENGCVLNRQLKGRAKWRSHLWRNPQPLNISRHFKRPPFTEHLHFQPAVVVLPITMCLPYQRSPSYISMCILVFDSQNLSTLSRHTVAIKALLYLLNVINTPRTCLYRIQQTKMSVL